MTCTTSERDKQQLKDCVLHGEIVCGTCMLCLLVWLASDACLHVLYLLKELHKSQSCKRLLLDDAAWNVVARHPACALVAVHCNICFITVGQRSCIGSL